MGFFRKFQIGLFFLFFSFTGCRSPQPNDILARVSEETILVSEFTQAMRREGEKYGPEVSKDPKRWNEIKQVLLEDLIQKKILLQEAAREGLVVTDEELEREILKLKSHYTEKAFQQVLEERKIDYVAWRELKRANLLVDRLIREKRFPEIEVPEASLRDYYDQHLKEFTQPEAVKVRQILTDTQEKAEAILKRLQMGENFASLARSLSIAPDRRRGGDLGFFSRGTFPKEFEVCFDLKEGELSPIVSSLYGFHIFKLIEKRVETPVPFEDVKAQIEGWLIEKAREEAFQSYYQNLRQHSAVEVNSWVLRKISL